MNALKKLIENIKNLFKKLFGSKKTPYYYQIDETSKEPVQVPFDSVPPVAEDAVEPEHIDVPFFTTEELGEMKKADLYELAVNSGLTEVSPKDTKATLIRKISDHYELQ